tara:strand:+ start:2201 stop:2356 length:156 start_codon:yes stop_codon:yes gene_type:complete
MYDDDKTWKQHYDDWVMLMERIPDNSPGNVFRRKIIQNLIDTYERNFIKDK